MALDENALITWSKLKSLFGITSDGEQGHYEDLINAASAVANRYTGRRLASRQYTEQLDGLGDNLLMLPEYPIQSVDSVYVDPQRNFAVDTEITDYLLYEDFGGLWHDGGFPAGRKNVKITYTAGFPSDGVPEDLQSAVAEIVAWMDSRMNESGVGVGIRRVEGPGGGQTEYEMTIPLAAQRKLDHYVRHDYAG
jgi:uncharacterized phiE125 gp8 family phage protein